jgi:WD40 repeat protein
MPRLRWLLLAAVLPFLFQEPVSGDQAKDKDAAPAGPVSYYRDVRKIFQQNCQGCHQPARAMGGYIMTSFADMLKPGDSGKAPVVVNQADKSELIAQVIVGADKKALMPKNKEPLLASEIELLRRWVNEGAKDDTPSSVKDTINEKNPPSYRQPPIITTLDLAPDGKLLAVAGFHEVLLHELEVSPDGKAAQNKIVARLIGLSERVQSLAFSPNGKLLAVAGGSPGRFGEIQVWDVAKRKLNFSVSITYDTLYGVSWSPDSTLIAFGAADNGIRAIHAETAKQVLYQGAHGDWVLGTTFSQDGEHLASISRDMSMKLTEVKTQRFVDNITSITPGRLKGGLQAVALRPLAKQSKVKGVDNADKIYDELLIGGSDGTPRLYKMHRVKQRTIGDDDNFIRAFATMPGRIFAARFNKDGTRFAVGSSLDRLGELRVFESETTKQISKLDKIPSVYTLAFSPDGKFIVSAGYDGKVRLSSADTGAVFHTFVPVPLVEKK